MEEDHPEETESEVEKPEAYIINVKVLQHNTKEKVTKAGKETTFVVKMANDKEQLIHAKISLKADSEAIFNDFPLKEDRDIKFVNPQTKLG